MNNELQLKVKKLLERFEFIFRKTKTRLKQ